MLVTSEYLYEFFIHEVHQGGVKNSCIGYVYGDYLVCLPYFMLSILGQ